jgi:hypothetical protein
MCKNGEFELEVKTTATPEITTTMFDGDGTDQKDYTLVEQTDNTIYIRARFTKKGYYKLTIFSMNFLIYKNIRKHWRSELKLNFRISGNISD